MQPPLGHAAAWPLAVLVPELVPIETSVRGSAGPRVQLRLVTLTEAELERVRQTLQERHDSFSERVDELGRAPEAGAAIGFGKRIGDGTTEAISRLTDIGVGRSLEGVLERVTRALEKLDEGTYGMCDACGREIPSARLEAMPDSVLCVTCAAKEPGSGIMRR